MQKSTKFVIVFCGGLIAAMALMARISPARLTHSSRAELHLPADKTFIFRPDKLRSGKQPSAWVMAMRPLKRNGDNIVVSVQIVADGDDDYRNIAPFMARQTFTLWDKDGFMLHEFSLEPPDSESLTDLSKRVSLDGIIEIDPSLYSRAWSFSYSFTHVSPGESEPSRIPNTP